MKVSLLLAYGLLAQINQLSCFWLTDSSLFQPVDRAPLPATTTSLPAVGTPSSTIEPPRADNQKQQQQQQKQEQLCQCNSDWIQNQTSFALARWLNSSQVTSQLRPSLVSNSTGGSGPIISNRSGLQQRNWPNSIDIVAGNNNNSSNGHTSQAIRKPANKWPTRHSRHGQQQQHQPAIKLVQGERGPQGPKGDAGSRGEKGDRGKSGLIVVKDRAELFDLNARNQKQQQQLQSSQAAAGGSQPKVLSDSGADRLVFVEADQMLVLLTSSGWRPIQLSRPLRGDSRGAPKSTVAPSSLGHSRKLYGSTDMYLDLNTDDVEEDDEDDNSISLEDDDDIDDESDGNNGKAAAAAAGREDDEEEDLDEEDEEDLDEDDLDDWDEGEDEDDYVIGAREKKEKSRKANRNRANRNQSNELAPLLQRSQRQQQQQQHQGQVKELTRMKSNEAGAPLQPSPAKVSGRSALPVAVALERPASDMRTEEASIDHHHQQQQASFSAQSAKQLKLRLVALNEPFSGNIHGIRGADFECKRHSAKARLRGSFRALLTTSFQNLNELVRLNTHKYPIVNLRGETLASSWNDLFKQQARMPNPLSRIYSFDGRHVATDSNWPNKLVWHGATNKLGYRDLASNCDGWHSDSLNKFGSATPLHNPRNQPAAAAKAPPREQSSQLQVRHHRKRHTNHTSSTSSPAREFGSFLEPIEKYPCRMPLIVLCIETIGQPVVEDKWRQQIQLENSWDSDIDNLL